MERSFIKGLEYLQENKIDQASREFDKVTRVFPKYEPVYLNIAYYNFQMGNKKKGKSYYNQSKWLSMVNSEVFSERGLVYSKYSKDFDKGIAFYNKHVVKNYLSQQFLPNEKK